MTYDTYSGAGELLATLDADRLCRVSGLDQSEVEWALEQYGLCSYCDPESGAEFHIVAHGDPLPAEVK